MEITRKIKDLCKKNRYSLKELSDKIGMSESGFHIALNNNDFKVSTLNKIAEFFKVSISYFLENTAQEEEAEYHVKHNIDNEKDMKIIFLEMENTLLRNTIEDKNKDLERFREIIDKINSKKLP
jgi:transcriptional regulator with XRE-family HTH domain